MNHTRIILMAILLLLLKGLAYAQPAANPDDLNRLTNDISKLLADPASQDAAVQQIGKLWSLDRPRTINSLRSVWLRTLLANQRWKDVEALGVQCMLVIAADHGAVEQIQTMRIRAAINSGKALPAPALAKSLYNVCPLTSSGNAMLLLAEGLNAAMPSTQPATAPVLNPRVEQFKNEQMSGALYAGKNPLAEKGQRSNVLDQIKVDAGIYDEALRKLTAEDYGSLLARGNLLLLADRPNEAMMIFERAYAQANDGQLPQASEAIARCLRAQDGTIGRANAWVQAIRPVKK